MPARIPKSGPLKGKRLIVDYGPKMPMLPKMHQLPSLNHGASSESWARPLKKRK
jgi:hypothetical protein